ncbi:MAG: DUF1501 domain-containing protein [Armatimonadetes bacterium]|nr:DUF1501 domain-containing protein [Armatimonadota bacterium]
MAGAGRYGHRHTIGVHRRELIQAGFSGLLGLGLSATLPRPASAAALPAGRTTGRAKAVILVFLTGGPSHLDTFDPKPDAPAEVRGEFGTIPTRIPGVRFAEPLPGLAARADRLALVRSMTHRNNGHLPATHWVLTGKAIPGIPDNLGVDKIRSRSDWPSYGSALHYFRPSTEGIPSAVNLPTYLQEPPLLWPGQYAGCLGAHHDPWQITDDPNRAGFRVENLSLPAGFAAERLEGRRTLLAAVNSHQEELASLAETAALTSRQQAAFTLLTSGRFGQAFRIEQEPAALRDRYGRHMFGQSLLLARRLVESGVPVVQANMGIVQTWDTHVDNWKALKNRLLPPLDQGVSALLDDLGQRGMLEETLVIVTGEFGRTPRVSTLAGQTLPGRDHWAEVFTSVFAGAGVRGGQVIGASDPLGGSPATEGYAPDDLGATVYHALGIDPASEFVDRENRPLLLSQGQVIQALYS